MTAFAALAAGGAVTWLLRVALIAFLPRTAVGAQIAAGLRYAPPAAFATLAVMSLTAAAHNTGRSVWPYATGAAITFITARFVRNLAVPLLAGAAAVTLLAVR